ncbi:transcription factor BIM2-like isoform X2 [Asparagus officinalis]|uniref:transcription factor BIM2-like isoform X2 n=1 Tax=Asparagus officinalis TaxID=4686 RepID=UPI00098E1E5C|nr:transcription factor BIM2-like isoform X2 [Asparagus officinalis]
MEFQGKKATHDFLSLYNKDSSIQLQDSRPPPQGFYLKTHDFLKPLEKPEEEADPAQQPGPTNRAATAAHVLPGGIGTFSLSHVPEKGSPAAGEAQLVTCAREPGGGLHAGAGFALWDTKENGYRGHWPSPFVARAATRSQSAQDKKRFMDSGSRSSRGFDEEDDDDEEFGKREGISRKVELAVKVDGKGGHDQKAMTPRSKHSATEQRRRSKINDRFQILRDLIPNSDQKRDKASFLLEVIEYIRFLQEKVNKYESSYPGWSDENAKLTPWNTNQVTKNGHSPGFIYSVDDDRVPAAPGMISTAQNPLESDTSAGGVLYKTVENPVAFTSKASSAPIPSQLNYASLERETSVGQPQQRLISDIDSLASQSQSQWLRPSGPVDCSESGEMSNEQEELTIDEGTINVSTAYSQNMLNALNQALASSGIDLSQANISVQINLGKRAPRRATATTMSSAKELVDPLSGNRSAIDHYRVGSSGEESEQALKRRRLDNS